MSCGSSRHRCPIVPRPDVAAFLGPSLDAVAAAAFGVDVRPPAEQGSVVRAVLDGARVIALVDGVFGAVPAVRHMEILWALSRGVAVVGAASVGALRAAELGPFGMQGIGLIARWYALTPLAGDDEVAVAVAPPELGSAALSEALVNMRLTFRRAARTGVVAAADADVLATLARAVPFVERGYERVAADARRGGSVADRTLDRLAGWLPANAVDRKRVDALAALRAVAQDRAGGPPPQRPFRMTEAWAYDLDASGLLDAVLDAAR